MSNGTHAYTPIDGGPGKQMQVEQLPQHQEKENYPPHQQQQQEDTTMMQQQQQVSPHPYAMQNGDSNGISHEQKHPSPMNGEMMEAMQTDQQQQMQQGQSPHDQQQRHQQLLEHQQQQQLQHQHQQQQHQMLTAQHEPMYHAHHQAAYANATPSRTILNQQHAMFHQQQQYLHQQAMQQHQHQQHQLAMQHHMHQLAIMQQQQQQQQHHQRQQMMQSHAQQAHTPSPPMHDPHLVQQQQQQQLHQQQQQAAQQQHHAQSHPTSSPLESTPSSSPRSSLSIQDPATILKQSLLISANAVGTPRSNYLPVDVCLTRDHEVLTRQRGWQAIDSVREGEDVWSLSSSLTDAMQMEWSGVSAIHKLAAPSTLVQLQGSSLNCIATPAHRWPVKRHHSESSMKSSFEWSRTDELTTQMKLIATAANPSADYQWNLPFLPADINQDAMMQREWLHTIGVLLASSDFTATASLLPSSSPLFLDSSSASEFISTLLHSPSSFEWLYRLSRSQAREIVAGFLHTSKSKGPCDTLDSSVFPQPIVTSAAVDLMQSIGMLAGYQTSATILDAISNSWQLNFSSSRSSDGSLVTIPLESTSLIPLTNHRETYVYCLTVTNGNFYTRRNDGQHLAPLFTGNCKNRPEALYQPSACFSPLTTTTPKAFAFPGFYQNAPWNKAPSLYTYSSTTTVANLYHEVRNTPPVPDSTAAPSSMYHHQQHAYPVDDSDNMSDTGESLDMGHLTDLITATEHTEVDAQRRRKLKAQKARENAAQQAPTQQSKRRPVEEQEAPAPQKQRKRKPDVLVEDANGNESNAVQPSKPAKVRRERPPKQPTTAAPTSSAPPAIEETVPATAASSSAVPTTPSATSVPPPSSHDEKPHVPSASVPSPKVRRSSVPSSPQGLATPTPAAATISLSSHPSPLPKPRQTRTSQLTLDTETVEELRKAMESARRGVRKNKHVSHEHQEQPPSRSQHPEEIPAASTAKPQPAPSTEDVSMSIDSQPAAAPEQPAVSVKKEEMMDAAPPTTTTSTAAEPDIKQADAKVEVEPEVVISMKSEQPSEAMEDVPVAPMKTEEVPVSSASNEATATTDSSMPPLPSKRGKGAQRNSTGAKPRARGRPAKSVVSPDVTPNLPPPAPSSPSVITTAALPSVVSSNPVSRATSPGPANTSTDASAATTTTTPAQPEGKEEPEAAPTVETAEEARLAELKRQEQLNEKFIAQYLTLYDQTQQYSSATSRTRHQAAANAPPAVAVLKKGGKKKPTPFKEPKEFNPNSVIRQIKRDMTQMALAQAKEKEQREPKDRLSGGGSSSTNGEGETKQEPAAASSSTDVSKMDNEDAVSTIESVTPSTTSATAASIASRKVANNNKSKGGNKKLNAASNEVRENPVPATANSSANSSRRNSKSKSASSSVNDDATDTDNDVKNGDDDDEDEDNDDDDDDDDSDDSDSSSDEEPQPTGPRKRLSELDRLHLANQSVFLLEERARKERRKAQRKAEKEAALAAASSSTPASSSKSKETNEKSKSDSSSSERRKSNESTSKSNKKR